VTLSTAAEAIVRRLTDPWNAVEPALFPRDRDEASSAGMYAWWGDGHARDTLGEEIGAALPPLLYVGQAGATQWPSGKRSSATLASRIGQQHVRGNARSSTFRLTISALLLNRLGLVAVTGGKLDHLSNRRVSEWIAKHLQVAVAPFHDRDALAAFEAEVVAHLDPPLNLGHCQPSNARARLAELRRALTRR
jgi:GIY-YIG catalytic domain